MYKVAFFYTSNQHKRQISWIHVSCKNKKKKIRKKLHSIALTPITWMSWERKKREKKKKKIKINNERSVIKLSLAVVLYEDTFDRAKSIKRCNGRGRGIENDQRHFARRIECIVTREDRDEGERKPVVCLIHHSVGWRADNSIELKRTNNEKKLVYQHCRRTLCAHLCVHR